MKKIAVKSFGFDSLGREAFLFTLKNNRGLELKVSNFGATIVSIMIPLKDGSTRDVALGFDSVSGYENTGLYLGATIGRYAGQIRDGKFQLNGKEYRLYQNDHSNTLHGGKKGFDKRLFMPILHQEENKIDFYYFSPDGEEGFPGNLSVLSSYQLTEDDQIIMRHVAQCDKDTVLNMTNHTYYNLDGHNSGSIETQELTIYAQNFLELAEDCCPNGKIISVKNTPMDFSNGKKIGQDISSDYNQLKISEGYDHNWNIDGYHGDICKCAELIASDGEIKMQMFSDLPGLQMYSGNYLNGSEMGKNGCFYRHRGALCLEPQFYPAAPNYEHFPTSVLPENKQYQHTIQLKFFYGFTDKETSQK